MTLVDEAVRGLEDDEIVGHKRVPGVVLRVKESCRDRSLLRRDHLDLGPHIVLAAPDSEVGQVVTFVNIRVVVTAILGVRLGFLIVEPFFPKIRL